MDINAKDLERLAKEYFKNLVPQGFQRDCERANFDFYNKMSGKIFTRPSVFHYYYTEQTSSATVRSAFSNYLSTYEEKVTVPLQPVSYADDFIYSLAA